MFGWAKTARYCIRAHWLGKTLILLMLAAAKNGSAATDQSVDSPDLPTDPLLITLIEQSLAARPELAQSSAELQAQRERVSQVGALPDPMLQLGVQNDGFSSWEIGKMETSWYSVMVSQTLPWPGKLRLRSELVALGARQAEQNYARVRLSTEAQVRQVYVDLVLARDRLALLDRLQAIWHKSAALARTRYETGQGAQSDLLRAQLELNRIQQRRWAMQAEAEVEVQALNRLRGHPLDEMIEPAVHLQDVPIPALKDAELIAQDALERSPELAAARLGAMQARESVLLARKSYLPDLTVNVGVMPRGSHFPLMWLVNVGGTLPIYSNAKQNRAVAENELRVAASEKNIQALEQQLRLRSAQRRATLGAILETIRLYQAGLLIQSAAAADSALAQYAVGKVTFASVLEANAGFIADQDGYLQALAQAHRLEIDRAQVSLNPVSSIGASMNSASFSAGKSMESSAPAPSSMTNSPATPTNNSSSSSSM